MSIDKIALFSAVVVFIGMSPANAADPKCFTVQSLQGSYAVIGNYGSNIAISLATRTYDGKGNLSGTSIINEPTSGSTTGQRTIITATNVGTYTVNCDGTGQFHRILTSNGVTSEGVDDFVITGAIVQGGRLIATTITDAQQIPSAIVPGGVFLVRTHTRLPDIGPQN